MLVRCGVSQGGARVRGCLGFRFDGRGGLPFVFFNIKDFKKKKKKKLKWEKIRGYCFEMQIRSRGSKIPTYWSPKRKRNLKLSSGSVSG